MPQIITIDHAQKACRKYLSLSIEKAYVFQNLRVMIYLHLKSVRKKAINKSIEQLLKAIRVVAIRT